MCLTNLFSLASRCRHCLFICSYSWLWIHYQAQGMMLCSPPFCAHFRVPPTTYWFTSQPLLIIAMCASLCKNTLGHSWLLNKCRRHTSCWSYSTERTDHTQTQAPKTEKSKAHVNLIWSSFLQPERERGKHWLLFLHRNWLHGDYFKGRPGQVSVDNTSLGIYFNMYPVWG